MMRRREFIALVGGRRRHGHSRHVRSSPAMPVIGYLESRSPDTQVDRLRAFRQGLKHTGYVEGENVRDRIPLGRKSS